MLTAIRLCIVLAAGNIAIALPASWAAEYPAGARNSPWADWVEADFPFFSSTLDAREVEPGMPDDNLTPRGLILNLGNDCWACFDIDLLRVSAVWTGAGITPISLAPKSYHPSGSKTSPGQSALPEPDGAVWLANGIYPGWQAKNGESLELADPRTPAPSLEEVGRGPLPEHLGRFQALQLTDGAPVLEYTVGETAIRESWSAPTQSGRAVVERHLEVGPSSESLNLVVGVSHHPPSLVLGPESRSQSIHRFETQGRWAVHIPARDTTARFYLRFAPDAKPSGGPPNAISNALPPIRWPQEVATRAALSQSSAAYVVDDIDLPYENPWRRNIRPGDIQFLPDGTGVMPTVDGDVWLARGLQGDLDNIVWKRFASGLHEPMTAAIRNGEIFVFDRNGIWRLRDTDGNGEADRHELFSNAFAQTADQREFPAGVRLAPNGEFVIAKGGQQATTLGKHNGSVLRISSDGKTSTVLGYGFRQPTIGVNPRTGLVTAGDQQGPYVPATPLHIVRDHQYYGYLSEGLHERETYPEAIADPLTWIPHSANASAMSQVWLYGAQMGPLNDGMIHIGFTRPEVFRVLFNDRGKLPQAAIVSISADFQHPLLHGSVNPLDGQLYVAGFQINGWGSSRDRLSGFSRVRFTGKKVSLPVEVIPMRQGALIRFGVEIDPAVATNPDNYSAATWNYKRTYRYGSPQYKDDGETGIDWLAPSSAYVSNDKRSVFIGLPGLDKVMQLRIGWALASTNGEPVEGNAYTTPYALPDFLPPAEGFADLAVDLTPRESGRPQSNPVTVEEGRRLYQMMGCIACHSIDGADLAKIGPTWLGLYGSERTIVVDGEKQLQTANEAYLRESIIDPLAKLVDGFHKGESAMPSYAGVLDENQIDALLLFIKSL